VQLRRARWRQLDDDTLFDQAKMWVKAHHVYGSLTEAVGDRYGAETDSGLVNHWVKWLRPFDANLGRPNTSGPWERRVKN